MTKKYTGGIDIPTPQKNRDITKRVDALLDYYNVPYVKEPWEKEASLNPLAAIIPGSEATAFRYMPSVSNKLSALIIFLKIPYIFTDGTKSWDCSLYQADGVTPVTNNYYTRGRGVCKNEDQREREFLLQRYAVAGFRFWQQFNPVASKSLPSITGKLNAILVHLANYPPPGKLPLQFTFEDQTESKNCTHERNKGGEMGNWKTNEGKGNCFTPNGQPLPPSEEISAPLNVDEDAEQLPTQDIAPVGNLDIAANNDANNDPDSTPSEDPNSNSPPAGAWNKFTNYVSQGASNFKKYNPNTPVVIKHKLNAILVWLKVPYLFDDNRTTFNCNFKDEKGRMIPGNAANEGKGYCLGKSNKSLARIFGSNIFGNFNNNYYNEKEEREKARNGEKPIFPQSDANPVLPTNPVLEISSPSNANSPTYAGTSEYEGLSWPTTNTSVVGGRRRSKRRKITKRRKYNRF